MKQLVFIKLLASSGWPVMLGVVVCIKFYNASHDSKPSFVSEAITTI